MTAIEIRNRAWTDSDLIPGWVRGREVGLDQHNTPQEVADYCWKSFQGILKKDKKQLRDYEIIEPSAGSGAFYNILPKTNRVGIDIELFERYKNEYIQADFLTWNPTGNGRYIAIGNPPFGYRGWLALSFLKHAAEFCDYVGFILPMSFQSEGKGSPKHRVDNMTLVHSEVLPDNLFISNNGDGVNVNTLWQVWRKKTGTKMQAPDLSASHAYADLFTVDLRKERLCGAEKMKDCNMFLQRTFYTHPPTLVDDFSKVKYGCGYGIIIKQEAERVKDILHSADWVKYSNLTTHNCRHISMYHIKQLLLDNMNA
jgi:hypothetical protein